MKRLWTSLLALSLVGTLCTPALAVEEESYTMGIQVNGSSTATVDRDSTLTVTLTMSRDGADTFDLYCMQDYVCFDPVYFDYVDGSLKVYTTGDPVETPVFSASALAFPASATETNRVYVNRVTDDAQTLSSGVTVLSFQLEAVKTGVTSITHDKVEVFRDPMQQHPYTCEDAVVTIQEPSSGGTGGSGGGTSGSDVVIEEPDTPLGDLPFVDVPSDAWYADAVESVVNAGLMNGTSPTTFSPNSTTDRAMLVTVLYRLEGSPAVTKLADFTDVADGTWYTDAVAWGAANGIIDGYGNGKFGPLNPVTREQTATILYRYVSYKGRDVSERSALSGYVDGDAVGDWALEAVEWAVADGLISGTNTNAILPRGYATRAQIAQILARLYENLMNTSAN